MRTISILSLSMLVTLGACKKEDNYITTVDDVDIKIELRDSNDIARTTFDSTENIFFVFEAHNTTDQEVQIFLRDLDDRTAPNVAPFMWYEVYKANGEFISNVHIAGTTYGGEQVIVLKPYKSWIGRYDWKTPRSDKYRNIYTHPPFAKGSYYLETSFRLGNYSVEGYVNNQLTTTRAVHSRIDFTIK